MPAEAGVNKPSAFARHRKYGVVRDELMFGLGVLISH